MEDYYKILGVSRDASKDEIKKAYRKLAHKHHPDKGGDENTFKKISEAYHVLSSDKKRSDYDRYGRSGPGSGAGAQGGYGFSHGGFDFDFGDIFEEFFGFGRGPRRRKRKGEDIAVRVATKLSKVIQDEEKTINISKLVFCKQCQGKGSAPEAQIKTCATCGGKGKVKKETGTFLGAFAQIITCQDCEGEGSVPEKKCSACMGEGRVKKNEKISFTVPAGVDSGQTLRIQGKGNAGRKGSPAGDLLIEIYVENDTDFERKGVDLYFTRKINFSEAVLGGKIDIKLLTGKSVSLKIPSGTPSGKVFRLSGKGLPRVSGYGQGDLYVAVEVAVPRKLTRKQKEILEELKKEGV